MRKSQTGPAGVVAGQSISNLAQERLKLAIFALKHQKRVSREIDLSDMSKESILALDQQHQMEKTFTNKLDGYAQATFKDLAKTFEMVSEQLEHGRGINGVSPGTLDNSERKPPLERIPAGRYGNEAEIARAVLFLVDPESAYITGQMKTKGMLRKQSVLRMDNVWPAKCSEGKRAYVDRVNDLKKAAIDASDRVETYLQAVKGANKSPSWELPEATEFPIMYYPHPQYWFERQPK